MIRRIEVYYDAWLDLHARIEDSRAGWAFVVVEDGKAIHVNSGIVLPNPTGKTDHAEYKAVIAALEWLIVNNLAGAQVRLNGDTIMIVNQMNGRWKVKGGELAGVHAIASGLARKFEDVCFTWITREENQDADRLARLAWQNAVPQPTIKESSDAD